MLLDDKWVIKILNHEDVVVKNKTKAFLIITVDGINWRVTKRMFTELHPNFATTDRRYFGDTKWFYNRFVAKKFQQARNSKKQWTPLELDVLLEMIEMDYTIGYIGKELEREVQSIIIKGAGLIDFDWISHRDRISLIKDDELAEMTF